MNAQSLHNLPHAKLVDRLSSNEEDRVESLNNSLQNMTQEELYQHYLNCQKLLSQNGSLQSIQSYNSLIEEQMGRSFPSMQHYDLLLLQLRHEIDKDQQHQAWFQQILQNLYQVVQLNLQHNPQTQQQLFFTAQQLGLQTIDPMAMIQIILQQIQYLSNSICQNMQQASMI